MISFDFDYYLPETVEEAVETFLDLNRQDRKVAYYGGGTEIISMARLHNIFLEAVIDIKAIPECQALERQNGQLVIGSAVTLTQIDESKLFPLLGSVAARIADHSIQGKITIGGNIAGTIIYHEALLPLFLTDCEVIIAGGRGRQRVPMTEVFKKQLQIERGDLIVQVLIDESYLNLPGFHVKKTKIDKIDYPVLTVAALKKDEQVRIGFSGFCDYPFRSRAVEDDLNQKNIPMDERLKRALSHLPAPIRNDLQSSSDYRRLLFENAIRETLSNLG